MLPGDSYSKFVLVKSRPTGTHLHGRCSQDFEIYFMIVEQIKPAFLYNIATN